MRFENGGGYAVALMGFDDSIGSKKFHEIIEHAKNGKTLIRMTMIGKDYERLTFIHDIRNKDSVKYLLIDYPDGFSNLVAGTCRQIQCEFTGSDHLSYVFCADIAHIDSDSIWLQFPEIVRRRQLRRDFRVDVPCGTLMVFKKSGILLKNQVINLSLGGSFGALISARDRVCPVWPLCVGDALTEIELNFRSKLSGQRVYIRKAKVVRFEENPVLHTCCFAIRFADMNKSEEKALTELIYVIQREYRLKRLPVAD